jgi:hypothetical protein
MRFPANSSAQEKLKMPTRTDPSDDSSFLPAIDSNRKICASDRLAVCFADGSDRARFGRAPPGEPEGALKKNARFRFFNGLVRGGLWEGSLQETDICCLLKATSRETQA